MPLTYPLAETARAALETKATARTVAEAREKAGAPVSLVSEWLRPSASERQTLQPKIDAGITAGFIQIYEDNQGQPVFGVAFWKQGAAPPAPPPPRQEAAPQAAAEPSAPNDSVDDLYFERGRTSRRVGRGRMRQGDPNQMDLFTVAGQNGFQPAVSGDPNVMNVARDGVGAGPEPASAKADRAAEAGPPAPGKSPKPKTARKPKAGG